ncbi:hypothetical protein IVB45_17510 [Bradyrhizobium sp. 4]|uniref:hypothetical protein n=1 Tax=unclassified Bradyrhizobium TaxID=2631580 RepID=UPI001FFB5D57|nr:MULTISPECIES: hypothetical protein [unclassified Bradyrhizobium]MCK1402027.1 hypothetical protein [Bradyrhizobium sp. 39]MCK1751253.1 hypothetical protein [Bradyrhizobium sp. 135]UPJ38506.1 hypothetical protein IVB45_17510 [Bradyrhizobium sp. 4]
MIEAKVQPIRRELDVAIASWLGPEARADVLVENAREILSETDARNRDALGQDVPHRTIVDGLPTEALERVRADGVIVRTYDVIPILLMEIGRLLWIHSPVKSGDYRRSHRLLADGDEIAEVREGWSLPSLPAGTKEFMFAPIVPYARPIERGWSKKAPDGVYQVVGVMGKAVFGKFAKISFAYREITGLAESRTEQNARPGKPRDLRQPVIIIQPN